MSLLNDGIDKIGGHESLSLPTLVPDVPELTPGPTPPGPVPEARGTTLGGGVFHVPTTNTGAGGKRKKKKKKDQGEEIGSDPSHSAPSSPSSSSSGGVGSGARSFVVKTQRENEVSSEEEEEEAEYRKGGYHPVALGQRLGRFLVRGKLGWGHFSTVWLAEDGGGREVALKVVKSASHYTEAAQDEVRILQRLSQADPSGAHCVIRLLDTFDIHGPHGTHVCMAFEKLGCNLLTLIRLYRYKGLPMPLVRIFAKQMVLPSPSPSLNWNRRWVLPSSTDVS